MGLFLAPALEDYWRHDGLHPTHPIAEFMSLNRFQQIKRFFHIAAIDIQTHTASGRRLWHGKVDPLLNQLRSSSQALRLAVPKKRC
jgi:Transposase IS4